MLQKLELTNFRNYLKRSFEFSPETTLIVGSNAVGKTNVLEAIYALATGKSFRADLEHELIKEGEQVSRLAGQLDSAELEMIWDRRGRFTKTYKINGVGKRQIDFVGNLRAVLFAPTDIEIVTDSPSLRRRYLDSVLVQVHKDYRVAAHIYEKALRQRNRLLYRIREEGLQSTLRQGSGQAVYRPQLNYWNELLISNGEVIHQRRKEFLGFLSGLGGKQKTIFPIYLHYDHSIISEERLARYSSEEVAAGSTLVGPHRDDFKVEIRAKNEELRDVKLFGSRGEQRLAVLSMKLGELEYVRSVTDEEPILLLDDIFSELDHENRRHVLRVVPKQQTIMTTTDLHLVDERFVRSVELVRLGE